MKKVLVMMMVFLILLSAVACADNTAPDRTEESADREVPSEASAPKTGEKLLVGWSGMFLDEQQTRLMNGGQGFVNENSDKYELYYVSADNSTEKQISDVETMIAMDCAVIIIDEIDPVCSSSAVKLCREAGVLSCAASTNLTEDADFEFVIDAFLLGAAQGEALNTWYKENPGIKLIAGYMLGTTSQQQTWDTKDGGYDECFTAKIDSGDLEIVVEETANWLSAEAVTLCENWITAYPEMNCVIAQNDDMALGAIQAAKAAGKTLGEDFFVFGKDGSETGLEALRNGEMAASVYLGFEGWGYTEVKMLIEKVEAALAIQNYEYGQRLPIVLDPQTCWQPILPDTVDNVIAYFDSLALAK